jgi:hypothetical protein
MCGGCRLLFCFGMICYNVKLLKQLGRVVVVLVVVVRWVVVVVLTVVVVDTVVVVRLIPSHTHSTSD